MIFIFSKSKKFKVKSQKIFKFAGLLNIYILLITFKIFYIRFYIKLTRNLKLKLL